MLGLFKSKKQVSQMKILVVDDEPDLVSTVEYRLKFANCQVVTAGNGQEGLERAAAEKPDLILLDTNMPGMNGHEMLERLRADPALQHIPVIMVTTRGEAESMEAGFESGCNDYLTKPIDSVALLAKVRDHLGL